MGEYARPRANESVLKISTESYPGADFATFPRKLVEPCVKAGTSEKGCCSVVGLVERELESERVATRSGNVSKVWTDNPDSPHSMQNGSIVGNRDPFRHVRIATTTGWHPTCSHDAPTVPCVVLDPFSGTSTTGVVSLALNRRYIGLDLSQEYLGQAVQRLTRPHAPIQRPTKPEHHPLFGDPE